MAQVNDFSEQQRDHQIHWRKSNISTTAIGQHGGKEYEHIIPKNNWAETLFSDIRDELQLYLKENKIQSHTGTNNLLSSWVVCANLYFPVRSNSRLKALMVDFLKLKISPEIIAVEDVELEFSFPNTDALHPSNLLGESGGGRGSGQTSPDVAFMVKTKNGKGVVLTECKYTEHSFYSCSARTIKKEKNRIENTDPKRCLINPQHCDYKAICHQTTWGRKYWEILKLSKKGKDILKRCPASTAGYQLFRQQSLAEGMVQSGRYSLVASTVSFDDRNIVLQKCLKSTGIDDFQTGWTDLFEGKALFKTWTHQEWVQFVRNNQKNGEFDSWLAYLKARYNY